jgi:hypothetical protein
LEFLGIFLRVLRLEVPVYSYNFYITTQFQTTFAQGEGGVKSLLEEENSLDFCPNYVQEFGL